MVSPRDLLRYFTGLIWIIGIFRLSSGSCADKDKNRALIEKTKYRLGGDPGSKALGCYFQDYAVYRPGGSELKPDKIDPNLCSFIIYFIVNLVNNEITSFDPWADIDLGGFRKIVALKQQNPLLRVTVATGGWNMGSAVFSNLASRPDLRAKFINSVIPFLEKWNFDGLDIDWEYPTQRGGSKDDYKNFPIFLKEIREAFDSRTSDTGKVFMLTAAISASVFVIDDAYNIPEVFKYLDFAQVMAYDFHGTWDVSPQTTAHHAPLFAPPQINNPDPNYNEKYSGDWAMQHYIEKGAPREKLLLGVPLYGRGWKLADPTKFTLGSPVNGPNPAGPFLREAGFLGVTEICLNMKNKGWQKGTQNNLTYVYGEGQWLGYDDEISVQQKAKYVWDNHLAGAFVWALDYEDNNQLCGIGRNPIISVLSQALTNPPNGNLIPAQVPVALVPPSIPVAPAPTPAPVLPQPAAPAPLSAAPVPVAQVPAPFVPIVPVAVIPVVAQPISPPASNGGPIKPAGGPPTWVIGSGLSPALKPGKPAAPVAAPSSPAAHSPSNSGNLGGSPASNSPAANAINIGPSSPKGSAKPFVPITVPPGLMPVTSSTSVPSFLAPRPGASPSTTDVLETVCSSDGFYQYPGDCTRFIRCIATQPPAVFTCSAPLYFDESIQSCNWPASTACPTSRGKSLNRLSLSSARVPPFFRNWRNKMEYWG